MAQTGYVASKYVNSPVSYQSVSKDNMDGEDTTSLEHLENMKKLPYPDTYKHNGAKFHSLSGYRGIQTLEQHLALTMKLKAKQVHTSGDFWYPSDNGGMGWHTNLDNNGFVPETINRLLYLTYVVGEGTSSFDYIDPDTGEYISLKDKPGWNVRVFNTGLEGVDEPLWHCVKGGNVDRFSCGFHVRTLTINEIVKRLTGEEL